LYLLSVGISNYGSPHLKSLSFAHKDATALSELFAKQNKGLYKNVDVRTLTDRDASRSAIVSHLTSIAARASQKDVVVVFLSGYASRGTNGEYYFLSHDTDVKRLEETAVLWKDLKAALEQLSAKVVLLVDTS